MSDPMTNTEVEDVLASIRRLVSDDKRPEAVPVQQPPNDRLVLTPSLRVSDEDGQETPNDDSEGAAVDHETEQGTHSGNTEAAFDPTTEMHGDDAPSVDEAEAEFIELPGQTEDPQGDDEYAVMSEPEIGGTDAEPDAPSMDEAMAAGEAPDAPEKDDVVEEDKPDDVLALQVPEDWGQEASADAERDEAGTNEPIEEAADLSRPLTQSLSEKIAALETLVGKRTDQFEPDDPGADAYAGTEPPAMAWEDADTDDAPADAPDDAPADTVAAAGDETPLQSEQEAPAQLFPRDEDVLDEDALRELVSDIVREELQGALGERITRNVRKLVRREIHRALATQDLE